MATNPFVKAPMRGKPEAVLPKGKKAAAPPPAVGAPMPFKKGGAVKGGRGC